MPEEFPFRVAPDVQHLFTGGATPLPNPNSLFHGGNTVLRPDQLALIPAGYAGRFAVTAPPIVEDRPVDPEEQAACLRTAGVTDYFSIEHLLECEHLHPWAFDNRDHGGEVDELLYQLAGI